MDIETLAMQIFESCSVEEVRLLISTLQDGLYSMEIDHPYVRSPFVQEYVGVYDNPDAHRIRIAATMVQTGNDIYIYPDHYSEVA